MKLSLAPVALALALTAGCGQSALLPDGGRPRQVCTNTNTLIGVKAVDLTGQPIAGAQVVATNASSRAELVGLTDSNGLTGAVTEAIGAGQIEIRATAGALDAAPFVVQVTCGECDCIAQPAAVTLILR